MIRLHNDDWGYETNCFVCEQRNEAGLQIPFFHDTDAGTVVAEFSLSDSFSGAPSFVHGGVSLAVLDEAMAWACIAVAHRWAVTTETTTRFVRPVLTDETFTVTASIIATTDATIDATAVITNAAGSDCATASASFTVLGDAQVARIAGDDAAVDSSYTR